MGAPSKGVRRFGGSDKATGLLLLRDANARLDGVTERTKLQGLLEEAYVVGDEPLARAVLLKAYRLHSDLSDMSPVVHGFFERFPDDLEKGEELQQASEVANKLERLGVSFTVGIL